MGKYQEKSGLCLARLFSDHAVLQREIPVPVWGWTRPGVRVQVKLGPYEAETRSGSDGRFMARLPPMPAGGPYELDVSTPEPAERVRVRDVMVGEVWVCSGQSNMEWRVKNVTQDTQKLTGVDQRIRTVNVPQRAQLDRPQDVDVSWLVADSQTVGDFSAVAFFFARRLSQELGVAVGLINASWGGTRIETWISREELVRHTRTRNEVARYESSVSSVGYWHRFDPLDPDHPQVMERLMQECFPGDPENTGFRDKWAAVGFDDSSWTAVEQPGSWTSLGYGTNGVFWFRREITIPADWAGKDLTLALGAIDKQDTTYFNGEQVGKTGKGYEQEHWNVPRVYAVPGQLVKAGRAVIAVRAYSFVYDGGLLGPGDRMSVAPADGSASPIPLAGQWRMKIEHDFGRVQSQLIALPFGSGNPQSPYMLHHNMIKPLIPYAIRGATWYQGESNDANARDYGWMLRAMIRDWRHVWGQGDFPFLTVQLANYRQPMAYEAKSSWVFVREAQLKSLSEPDTGLAVAIDLGEAADIHPRNKEDVGSRLAQWALARTYNKPIPPSGPLYRRCVIEGDRIRLYFDHTGSGLMAKNGALKTFAIAGAAMNFVPAEAEIVGDTVVVRASAVPEPLAVRYAWADNPDGCNLYNREGLPASPFRTDAW